MESTAAYLDRTLGENESSKSSRSLIWHRLTLRNRLEIHTSLLHTTIKPSIGDAY